MKNDDNDDAAKALLAEVVKSLDGMADGEDGMYFQEMREELTNKDKVINQKNKTIKQNKNELRKKDKIIKESKETINNLMNELAKYKSNYAQS